MASHDDSIPPSSPPPIPRSLKRQASLLPAFDFVSSSPPRFTKRQAVSSPTDDDKPSAKGTKAVGLTAEDLYPTPVPTSSLGIPPSSPPPPPYSSTTTAHPPLRRTNSMLSELRAPLTSVPSILLPIDGEPVLLGRSSVSCDYQLSNSRLISRVHVRAVFLPEEAEPTVMIECVGWNGVKVHCQGHVWSLEKGDCFTSETVGAEIMLDVQDARVVLHWPENCRRKRHNVKAARKRASAIAGAAVEAGAKDTSRNARKSPGAVARNPLESPGDWNNENVNPEEKSPTERFLKKKSSSDSVNSDQGLRARSPVQLSLPDSPTPYRVRSSSLTIVDASVSMNSGVSIYEDEADEILLSPASSEDEEEQSILEANDMKHSDDGFAAQAAEETKSNSRRTQRKSRDARKGDPQLPEVSLGEPEEEGPAQSQNIDPEPRVRSSKSSAGSREKVQLSPRKVQSITSHLIDQLAFSRLSSTPLSTLCSSLPPSLSGQVTVEGVLDILHETRCIGEVRREGKDAVGKKLENEYYYNMDKDDNEGRKMAVTETIGKSGIRACRKVHKVSYRKRCIV